MQRRGRWRCDRADAGARHTSTAPASPRPCCSHRGDRQRGPARVPRSMWRCGHELHAVVEPTTRHDAAAASELTRAPHADYARAAIAPHCR